MSLYWILEESEWNISREHRW